jgi:hypothetical protein
MKQTTATHFIFAVLAVCTASCQSASTTATPTQNQNPKIAPLPESTIRRRAKKRPAPAKASEQKRREQKRQSRNTRQRLLEVAINRALEYEISGQRLSAIRAYRSASIYADNAQRLDIETRARQLLNEHMTLEKRRESGLVSIEPTQEPKSNDGIHALKVYLTLREPDLEKVLRRSTPSERLRDATGGFNSFLAQAAAHYGHSAQSQKLADSRLRQFRQNEAHLTRFRRRRDQLKSELARSERKRQLYGALQGASDRFVINDYLDLFKLQDSLRAEIQKSAKLVHRVRLLTRSATQNTVFASTTVQERNLNSAELFGLLKAHHKAQLKALKQSASLTPQSLPLLLRGENLRQQRVISQVVNNAIDRRTLAHLSDLIQAIERHR